MSEHGVVQTQAEVRLDDVMIGSPNPPIYFGSTYRVGTLLAYNATTNKYVPYLDTDLAANVPDCVLMNEIVTTAAGDYFGLLAKGVARRSRLVRGAGVDGASFDDATLPALAVALARNRGLFIVKGS